MNPVIELAAAGVADTARRAAALLCAPGTVLLLPTETVYGLVCRADDETAVRRIYELKGRAAAKKLGWFVADWRKLPEYGVVLDGLPAKLAERYCPGPITIIAPLQNGDTVGFRVPDHPLLAEILKLAGCPLAQTSANHSGEPDARNLSAALAGLTGEVTLAVDGGAIAENALASTVVDAAGTELRILRQGALHLEDFQNR